MVHIILTILKILLITIGIILGLLILLVCGLLFVPVRYNSKGRYMEKPEGTFQVSWLLKFIRINGVYGSEGMSWKLKVLFFTIKRSDKETDDFKEVHRKKKKVKKSKENNIITEKNSEAEVPAEAQQETEITESIKKSSKEDEGQDTGQEGQEPVTVKYNDKFNDESEKSSKNPFKKITGKIKGIISGLRERIKNIAAKIKEILLKAEELKQFIVRDDVKKELSVIKEQLIRLVKHIIPVKLKGNIHFGTGEPDKTGIAAGMISMLYGLYGRNINITADFKEKVLNIDYSLKGRIRIFTVLMILLKIYNQKTIVNYIKNFKNS